MKKLKTFVSSFLAVVMLCLASMNLVLRQIHPSQPLTGPTKDVCRNV